MPRKQAISLLKIASEQVPHGIYGLEHIGKGYMELTNIPMGKKLIRQKRKEYGKQGIKIYANE